MSGGPKLVRHRGRKLSLHARQLSLPGHVMKDQHPAQHLSILHIREPDSLQRIEHHLKVTGKVNGIGQHNGDGPQGAQIPLEINVSSDIRWIIWC